MRRVLAALRSFAARAWHWVSWRRIPLTSLGWATFATGLVAWWAGVRLGWQEVQVLAACCLVSVVIGILWVIRAPRGVATITVTPDRVVVGGDAVGELGVTNRSQRRTPSGRVVAPVGSSSVSFVVPALGGGDSWGEIFVVPTSRRSIVTLGPPRVVRADPLGMARREIVEDQVATLYVHPRTAHLPPIATGLLRDLDGATTNDLSNSDVAFHTLREYVPGDELRQVHWRTTARLGTLMVRQFVDTRRSRLGLVMSTLKDEWADEDEFELGVSVLASIGRVSLAEQHPLTTIIGDVAVPSGGPTAFLDGVSGVVLGDSADSLAGVAAKSALMLRGSSLIALVAGSGSDVTELRRSALRFGPGVRVLAVRCDLSATGTRQVFDHVSIVSVGSLETFSRTVARGAFG